MNRSKGPGMKNRHERDEWRRWTENVKKEGTDKLFWLQTAERTPKITWSHLMCTHSAAKFTNHKTLAAIKLFSLIVFSAQGSQRADVKVVYCVFLQGKCRFPIILNKRDTM
ncbi:hypothetical protein AMECASPLE_019229 [Ameca splendens]|uniref:Uncharacterized protein n=1 Tax=Ameca splendens TaxID=208324 RepID=A0ABV0ZBQ1_9TELE